MRSLCEDMLRMSLSAFWWKWNRHLSQEMKSIVKPFKFKWNLKPFKWNLQPFTWTWRCESESRKTWKFSQSGGTECITQHCSLECDWDKRLLSDGVTKIRFIRLYARTMQLCTALIQGWHIWNAYLDNDIRHTHLLAEGWKPDNQLNGVHIMCDHHQLCFPLLYKSCDVVQAILHHNRLLLLYWFSTLASLCLLQESFLQKSYTFEKKLNHTCRVWVLSALSKKNLKAWFWGGIPFARDCYQI